jgi:hypothetical protein
MRVARLCIFTVAILAFAATSSAATRHVSVSGTDTGDCIAKSCRTITYAASIAAPGDTIKVAPGTYKEDVSINKRLTIVGSNTLDASHPEPPSQRRILDAAGLDNGFVIAGAGAAGTVVRGFTVENAGREGILATQTSNLKFVGNVLQNNDAYGPNSEQCPPTEPDDCGEALHLNSVSYTLASGNLVENNVGGILLTDEDGPNHGNVIVKNKVVHNDEDCGITLASHYFNPTITAPPDEGGVYDNYVLANTANSNGAAGIGVFAGPPGAAAYRNYVIGNVANDNGLPGVAIHSHTPNQYVNDNVVEFNSVSENGPDEDVNVPDPTGIIVFSAVVPIPRTTVAFNYISKEHYGIYTQNAVQVNGLHTNRFRSVDIPISQH